MYCPMALQNCRARLLSSSGLSNHPGWFSCLSGLSNARFSRATAASRPTWRVKLRLYSKFYPPLQVLYAVCLFDVPLHAAANVLCILQSTVRDTCTRVYPQRLLQCISSLSGHGVADVPVMPVRVNQCEPVSFTLLSVDHLQDLAQHNDVVPHRQEAS